MLSNRVRGHGAFPPSPSAPPLGFERTYGVIEVGERRGVRWDTMCRPRKRRPAGAGLSCKPSNGLEPLTPSLPCRPGAPMRASTRQERFEITVPGQPRAERTTAELRAQDDYGKLWSTQIGLDGERAQVVEVVNATPESDGSYRRYFLRVPQAVRTAREAVAWTSASTTRTSTYSRPKAESSNGLVERSL